MSSGMSILVSGTTLSRRHSSSTPADAVSIPIERNWLNFLLVYLSMAASWDRRTLRSVLGRLQNRTGAPNLRTRVLAACVLLGMVVLTAPLAILPAAHWLARFL
jgi:hypothetical protein